MFRPLLLVLLALAPINSAHAQDVGGGPESSSSYPGSDALRADSGRLRLAFDPRLVSPADLDASPLATTSGHAAGTHAFAPRSYWKAGAAIGAVVGAVAGFGLGYGMDNIINEGEFSVGEATVGGTVIGAVGGALLGAGIGSLIKR